MGHPRRLVRRRPLGAVAVVLGTALALASCAGAPASVRPLAARATHVSPSTQRPRSAPRDVWYSKTASIVNGRFVKPFELDADGVLVLPPPTGYRPERTLAIATEQAWATQWLSGRATDAIGLGEVWVRKGAPGLRPTGGIIAWVALVNGSNLTFSCPADVVTPGHPSRPPTDLHADGWSAVIIGDRLGSPAVVYQAANDTCDHVHGPTLTRADETVSTPWRLTGTGVETTVPSCATTIEEDFSSTRTTTAFRYEVALPIASASLLAPGSTAIPSCRDHPAPRVLALSGDPEASGVGPQTWHQRTGLVGWISPRPHHAGLTTVTT